MKETLNPAIAGYLNDLNARDNDSLIRRFAPEAVVVDEGQTYRGIDEIHEWLVKTQAAFEFTLEPLRAEQQGGETILMCQTTGTFPGSPVDLRHFITLEGDKIAALTIQV
jgi:hypothetical protein